jgi:DNA repair protein RecN
MLLGLSIRNLALIETLELELGPGLTVLTGETGAGKSILIDALGLVLGARADAGLIRAGAAQAEVSAEFDLADSPAARAWFAQQAIDCEEQRCVLRRVVQDGGRHRAFVNQTPVSLSALRELGETLVDIFGQGESQRLMRAETQRELLDRYGQLSAERTTVAEAAARLREALRAAEAARSAAGGDPAQLALLDYQVQELDALGLAEDEVEALELEQTRLASAGRLLGEGAQAHEALYGGEDSVYDRLSGLTATLEGAAETGAGTGRSLELAAAAQAQVQEAAESARRTLERLDLDPERLAEVENRLEALHDLARKHRVRPRELHALHLRLRAERDRLAGAGDTLAAADRQVERERTAYRKVAAILGEARRRVAPALGEAVSERLRGLGLPHARLQVSVDTPASERWGAEGQDEIRFDFSANPGQPLRPLSRVASGGELSRISLAIEVVGGGEGAGTRIFDEVDTGVGGAVAEVVGAELRAVAASAQVLCVTHLAQVAAQGHAQLVLRKRVADGLTRTEVDRLDAEGRVAELARMSGGREVTDAARAHARELLERAARG